MTEILRPKRNYALAATVLFFAAYAAIMVLILAPKDTFQAIPASMVQPAE
ncbi:hypothetical protein G5B31_12410 [Rhodobacter sp. SGA-6-6]|nr:hypothetical protein [Rhodobacter sp. SGA-6-6]NGM46338.1 hypothetical protein [Rhodobacter sp. SGA-6-6]